MLWQKKTLHLRIARQYQKLFRIHNQWNLYIPEYYFSGAFVFPFVLMLLLLGIPLMFLELSLGQYAALGPSVLFDRLCPLFHGKYRIDQLCNVKQHYVKTLIQNIVITLHALQHIVI